MADFLILGVGVSLHKTDGVIRFEHYCNAYNLPYVIVGEGHEWRGGMENGTIGGGQKLNEVLEVIKDMDNKLILICDTFDLFPVAYQEEIITKYEKLCPQKQILISAEIVCWPDKALIKRYPQVSTKYRYLNSGCIMGYRDDIYRILSTYVIEDKHDDQLYFTLRFLEANNNILLDYNCSLFQTLYAATPDVVVHNNRVYNKYTNTYPVFIHGNGLAKLDLNRIENYLSPYPLKDVFIKEKNPKVFFALYIDSRKQKEMENFLLHVDNLNYENKIIYFYDSNPDGTSLPENYYHTTQYRFNEFLSSNCDYYFLLEQQCIITNPDTVVELVNRADSEHRILAPLLKSKELTAFSNYWGALDRIGYYVRADDYIDVITYEKRGYWNAAYVSGAILIHRSIFNWDILRKNKFNDRDMNLCSNFRDYTLFMYMINFDEYGMI